MQFRQRRFGALQVDIVASRRGQHGGAVEASAAAVDERVIRRDQRFKDAQVAARPAVMQRPCRGEQRAARVGAGGVRPGSGAQADEQRDRGNGAGRVPGLVQSSSSSCDGATKSARLPVRQSRLRQSSSAKRKE